MKRAKVRPMSAQQPATSREIRWIGAGAIAAGLYFPLVGLGLLPVPGGPRNLHGPLWLLLLVGVAFFLAGVAALVQVVGRANASGDLPPDAPQWMRIVQYLIGVAIFGSFAMIGSWVAFGDGPRAFSGSFLFFDGATNASIGRIAFGIGAVITWLCTVAFAVSGARKLLRRGKS
jgi:hypothetical protein